MARRAAASTRRASGTLVPLASGALVLLAVWAGLARAEPIPASPQAAGERAAAQGDDVQQRLRQLEVFEKLLTETVQRYVNAQVNAGIEEEMAADAVASGRPAGDPSPLVVKLGASSGAHGIYIDGYGVIFSIQRPQVSVLPRAFAIHLEEPLVAARRQGEPVGGVQRVNVGVFRYQSSMIQRQLREMEAALERQIAAEADAAQIALLRAEIEKLRAQTAAVESRFATLVGEPLHADPESVAEHTDRRLEFFGEMVDRQRSMREVLERNHVRMRAAVNDAATDTLANWGRVITGLQDDDRLSVLVLPPTPWNLAQRHGVGVASEEYVISIRYRDVRDFDGGRIDLDEFRRRARIHDRLGLEISRAPQQRR